MKVRGSRVLLDVGLVGLAGFYGLRAQIILESLGVSTSSLQSIEQIKYRHFSRLSQMLHMITKSDQDGVVKSPRDLMTNQSFVFTFWSQHDAANAVLGSSIRAFERLRIR